MKIQPEHYNQLLEAIRPLADQIPYHQEAVIKQGKSKDIALRVRWDVLHAACRGKTLIHEIYSYANDEHIDTALRRIFVELGVQTALRERRPAD